MFFVSAFKVQGCDSNKMIFSLPCSSRNLSAEVLYGMIEPWRRVQSEQKGADYVGKSNRDDPAVCC